MIVEAIHYDASVLGHYFLHAFVVMPNHVQLLAAPAVTLFGKRRAMTTSCGVSGKLLRTGPCSAVRSVSSLEKIRSYIEGNPVRAALVREANEYRWSSAGGATRGSAPPCLSH